MSEWDGEVVSRELSFEIEAFPFGISSLLKAISEKIGQGSRAKEAFYREANTTKLGDFVRGKSGS